MREWLFLTNWRHSVYEVTVDNWNAKVARLLSWHFHFCILESAFWRHIRAPRGKLVHFVVLGDFVSQKMKRIFFKTFDFLLLLKISKNFGVLSATLSRLWTRWATKIVDKVVLLCRCDDAMKKILGFEGRNCRKIRWNYFFWKCHKSC